MKLQLVILAALSFGSVAMFADTISIHLNQSNENYVLNGTGGLNGYATYDALPGDCATVASVTSCTLTGSYTGSTPGYTAGTYILTTSFDSSNGGLAATSTTPVASPSGGNFFTIVPPVPGDNMTLTLNDISGTSMLPLIVDGVDLGNLVTVAAVHSTCAGLPSGTPCTQGNVGLNTTASIFGPVTGEVTYTFPAAATPEPGFLALGGSLPGVLLVLRKRHKV